MEYYHNIITKQSWEELKRLRQQAKFVLIGGWATYLYTKALKSKDIDIIIEFDQLGRLSGPYQLIKNDRLKKYEARRDTIHIDIYLPHYSLLGIPVEDLITRTQSQGGFTVLEPIYLTALKIYVLQQRGHSAKGKKDFIDVVSLWRMPNVSSQTLQPILQRYNLMDSWQYFTAYANDFTSLPELNLNQHQYAKWKTETLT